MTIAKRLAILILIAVAGLVMVGAFGLRQMGAINANLEFANENSIPSIRMVANMESSFFRLRTFMLTYIMSPDAERPALAQQVMNNRERLQGYVKGYEPLVSDDKDKEYLENSKRMLAEYFSLIDRQMASIRAGQVDKAKEDAVLAGALGRRIADNVEAHIKYNEELATQEVRKAAEAYSSGKVVSMIVMVLATLGVAGLGFLVYRHVEQSLGNMVTMFKRIEHDLDFTGRLEVRGSDEVAQASTAFNRLLDRLQASFREISSHTEAVNTAANRVANASHEMSIASGHQSEAASSMAATVEEMTVSINHVADRAGEANQLSTASGELAHKGEGIIGDTVAGINSIAETVRYASEQISRLEQQSERINNVVSVIKEVADQTNLLALNAAIEAARAGEQGRGFAVVADEVRKLAERTTQSTQEIASTILEMQAGAQAAVHGIHAVVERVDEGVSRAEQANEAIQEIGEGSRKTVDMVGDISDAIREQSMASTAIAQQVEKIAQMSEENSAAAQSTSDTAGELAHLAQEMQQVVAQYRL